MTKLFRLYEDIKSYVEKTYKTKKVARNSVTLFLDIYNFQIIEQERDYYNEYLCQFVPNNYKKNELLEMLIDRTHEVIMKKYGLLKIDPREEERKHREAEKHTEANDPIRKQMKADIEKDVYVTENIEKLKKEAATHLKSYFTKYKDSDKQHRINIQLKDLSLTRDNANTENVIELYTYKPYMKTTHEEHLQKLNERIDDIACRYRKAFYPRGRKRQAELVKSRVDIIDTVTEEVKKQKKNEKGLML